MEIINISQVDEFSAMLNGKIDKKVLQGALIIRDKARDLLKSNVNKADSINPKYDDTLLDGIYAGALQDKKIKITSLGNLNTGSGTFRTKFFVGGTKKRYIEGGYRKTKQGIQYVRYKKPMTTGSISPLNCISIASTQCEDQIHNLFTNIE